MCFYKDEHTCRKFAVPVIEVVIVMGGDSKAVFKLRVRRCRNHVVVGSNAASHPMTWGHKGRTTTSVCLLVERGYLGSSSLS